MDSNHLINALVKESVDNAFKHYGIEGTLETIKKVYSLCPRIKENMLSEIDKRLK